MSDDEKQILSQKQVALARANEALQTSIASLETENASLRRSVSSLEKERDSLRTSLSSAQGFVCYESKKCLVYLQAVVFSDRDTALQELNVSTQLLAAKDEELLDTRSKLEAAQKRPMRYIFGCMRWDVFLTLSIVHGMVWVSFSRGLDRLSARPTRKLRTSNRMSSL